MSQRIVTLCDFHQARDEEVYGEPVDLAIRSNGGAFKFLTVDLCESCRKSLDDVFAEVLEHGREFDGDPAKAVKAKRSGRPRSSEEERTCSECQHVFSKPSALRLHLKDVHGIGEGVTVQPSEDGKFHCPDCAREFDRPQALGAHRRVHKDGARADG